MLNQSFKINTVNIVQRVFILKTVSLFRKIPGNLLAEIAPFLREVHVKAGERIIKKGEIGKSMYIIVEGKVRVHDKDKKPKTLKKREIFCELAVLSPETHTVSVTAVEETDLFRLDQDILYELMSEYEDLARVLIQELTRKFL